MAEKITTKKFASNVILSIFAQIINLAVSFVLTLIVPKFIPELQYAEWQIYVLYVGYVGVLHFGLLDGLVLRYSKYDYDELDKPRICSQFRLLLAATSIIAIIITAISICAVGGDYKVIILLVALGIITKNLVTYSSYLFQITNRISKYVLLIILQRLVYGIFVVILLLLKVDNFYWYCIADLFGDLVGIVIGYSFNKNLFLGKSIRVKESLSEAKINISSGIVLMLANWSAMLMTGAAKMIIQWHWSELLFGKVSFAFSVLNIFLVFVSAISVVLFPSLQRVDADKLPTMYKNIRSILSPLLFFMMIFYFIGCWILNKWLPLYSVSLSYLALVLPIIVFSSKVSLLTNNYLKVYRKEKLMLVANATSIVIGAILFVLSAYVFDNLTMLLLSVVFVVMFNSILSEIFVLKTIHKKIVKDFILEGIMTICFILCATLLDLWVGCLVYILLYIVYAIINFKSMKMLFKSIIKGRNSAVTHSENKTPIENHTEQKNLSKTERNNTEKDI